MPPQNWTLKESRDVSATAEKVFEAFRGGEFFRLTGASQITFDFADGGLFNLMFHDRGSISGRFLAITNQKRIAVSWNVTGFGRADEFSNVTFSFTAQTPDSTRLEVEHSAILSVESMEAKKRAWQDILQNFSDLHS